MRIAAILILLALCVGSMAQPSSLLHKSYADRFPFFDSLHANFPSTSSYHDAIIYVNDLKIWAEKSGDPELAAQFSLIALDYTIARGMATDADEKQLLQIVDYTHRNHYEKLEADALILLGKYWNSKKKSSITFEYYRAAYNIYSKFSGNDFPPRQYYLYDLAINYLGYGDQDNAIKILQEARQSTAPDNRNINPVKNAIGMYYRNKGMYDSARFYFQQIYDTASKVSDHSWMGIAAGNIGICYFYEKKYDQAIPLLQQDIEIGLSHRLIQNALHSMNILAEIYYDQHKPDKSEELLKKIFLLGQGKGWWPSYKIEAESYLLLAKVFRDKNEMSLAYKYLDSARIAKDSLDAQFNALNMSKAQERIGTLQQKLEKNELENEKKVQTILRNSLISIVFFITIICALLIIRQIQKRKELSKELTAASAQLETFRQNIIDKNNIIEQITNEVEKIRNNNKADLEDDMLVQLQSSIILTDEQWESFRSMFEKVHRNFFSNLKKKMPDLTQAEIRLLALTKLGMSSKAMASMMGISPATIRIYRHRLRKKLNLDREELIEELVNDI